jgi:tetratricopeptide (TPR) repeat protein
MANSARIDELRQKFDENPRRYFAPLANEYRKAGDLGQAIFICEEYLPQQPGHMSGHIVYGQALYESGRYDDAKAVFETALSLDPENLIALRHLGDIARQGDDLSTARQWYRRALEVDPRNEEISALIDSLPGPGATPQPTTGGFEPMSLPPIPMPASSEFVAESAELEVERSEEAVSSDKPLVSWHDESRSEYSEQFEPIPPPAAPAPPEASSDELLDLDDLSFESFSGAPTSSGSDEFGASAPELDITGEGETNGGFTLPEEDAALASGFGTPPAPSPDIELATDLELGLVDDGTAQSTSASPTTPLAGLESFEAGTLAAAPLNAPALEVESFFDLPSVPPPVESAAVDEEQLGAVASIEAPSPEEAASAPSAPIDGGHDGLDIPETPATPEEVFVTETMAELYIQQGHVESALDIYRKLVEQRPDEPDLRDRLRAIEDRLFGSAREAEGVSQATPGSRPAQTGPTIREFLSALIAPRRSPGQTAPGSRGANGSPRDVGEASRDSLEQRPSMRATPNSGETVSGSIDALFSGAIATASDSMAAITLSDAFAPDEPDETPLKGAPARRAEDELSLDHVFRANQPISSGAGKDDFSFDEFFAEEANEGTSGVGGDASGASAPDDIAQFNAWLNGLKKT